MSSSAAAIPAVGGQYPDDGIYLLISREDLDHAGAYRCPSRRPPPLAWLVAVGLCKVVGLGCGIRGLVGASDGKRAPHIKHGGAHDKAPALRSAGRRLLSDGRESPDE